MFVCFFQLISLYQFNIKKFTLHGISDIVSNLFKKKQQKTTTKNQRKTPHDESVLFSHLNIN